MWQLYVGPDVLKYKGVLIKRYQNTSHINIAKILFWSTVSNIIFGVAKLN